MKQKNNQQILTYKEHIVEQGISVPLLHFKLLEEIEGIKHCFTTRGGGVSENELSSMNLSFTRGDKEENVNPSVVGEKCFDKVLEEVKRQEV